MNSKNEESLIKIIIDWIIHIILRDKINTHNAIPHPSKCKYRPVPGYTFTGNTDACMYMYYAAPFRFHITYHFFLSITCTDEEYM